MRSVAILLVPLVFAAASALQAADEPPKPELRIYDVEDIVTRVPDRPAEPVTLASPPAANDNGNVFGPAEPDTSVQHVADVIRNRIYPESWDPNMGTSIEERAGKLVIMQTPGVHGSIENLLANMRATVHPQISVQTVMVEVEPAALLPFLGKAGKTFTQEQVLAAVKSGRLAGAPQFTMINGQRSHLLSGVLRSYIADQDIAGNTSDPVVRKVMEGNQIEARPLLSPDREACVVDLRINTGANAKIEDDKEAGESLQHAQVDERELRAEVVCATGKWTLAGTLPPARQPEDGKAALNTLVFVQVGHAR